MGITKVDQFKAEDRALADLAKAIGHPARIAILKLLLAQKGCICRDIVDELPLAQSTISQHLKELKNVGLIKGEIEGASICYCIDEQAWQKAAHQLKALFELLPSKNLNCC